MADAIRVCIAGHRGKVGSVLEAAFANEPGIEYVGGISRGDDLAAFLHEKRPSAFVDFTRPSKRFTTPWRRWPRERHRSWAPPVCQAPMSTSWRRRARRREWAGSWRPTSRSGRA